MSMAIIMVMIVSTFVGPQGRNGSLVEHSIDSPPRSRARIRPRIKTQTISDRITDKSSKLDQPFELVRCHPFRSTSPAYDRRIILHVKQRQSYPCLFPRQRGTDHGGCKFRRRLSLWKDSVALEDHGQLRIPFSSKECRNSGICAQRVRAAR